MNPALLTLAGLTAAGASAQMSQPMVGENTTKISDHVWAIMGFPNIAVVVGSSATLVVDTGMGPRNGATAARVAAKLAPGNQKLFHHYALPSGTRRRRAWFSHWYDPDPQLSAAAGNGSAWPGDHGPVQPKLGAK
jgi:hypothetical protein